MKLKLKGRILSGSKARERVNELLFTEKLVLMKVDEWKCPGCEQWQPLISYMFSTDTGDIIFVIMWSHDGFIRSKYVNPEDVRELVEILLPRDEVAKLIELGANYYDIAKFLERVTYRFLERKEPELLLL